MTEDTKEELVSHRAQLAAADASTEKWIKHHDAALAIIEQQTSKLASARKALEEIIAEIAPNSGGTQGAIRRHAVNALRPLSDITAEKQSIPNPYPHWDGDAGGGP